MATQTEDLPFKTGESLPPPASTTGVLPWLRRNLFSSPLNSVLTLISLYLLWLTVPPALNWLIFDATFTGSTPEACVNTTGPAGPISTRDRVRSSSASTRPPSAGASCSPW